MLLSVFFILLLVLLRKTNKIVLFIIILHVVSLISGLLVNNNYSIITLKYIFNLAVNCIYLTLIILPWRYYSNIKNITCNFKWLNKFTYIILFLSLITFLILLPTSIIVSKMIDDVNTFKYQGGYIDFFYNYLPFNVQFYILATFLYGLSYFLIPLFFIYLSKKKYCIAFLCLLFSFNIALYGFTYFSRAMIVHFVLIFFSIYILLYNILSVKIVKTINKIMTILAFFFVTYFIIISLNRFKDNRHYESLIPQESYIQDPILYSTFDYLSQGINNGFYVLEDYNYETFMGQITLQDILRLAGQYGIIKYSTDDYVTLRKKMWPNHFSTFNGFVAYVVYDFGYFFSFLLCIFYYIYLIKKRPRHDSFSATLMLNVVLLIQIPLFSIFYSPLGGLIIPLILYLVIRLFSKMLTSSQT